MYFYRHNRGFSQPVNDWLTKTSIVHFIYLYDFVDGLTQNSRNKMLWGHIDWEIERSDFRMLNSGYNFT